MLYGSTGLLTSRVIGHKACSFGLGTKIFSCSIYPDVHTLSFATIGDVKAQKSENKNQNLKFKHVEKSFFQIA